MSENPNEVAYYAVPPSYTAGHRESPGWWLGVGKVDGRWVDGGFLPSVTTHGYAALWHIRVEGEAVTILALHDYSGDGRNGSHCTLAARGHRGPDEVLALARGQHPRLMGRIEALGPVFVYVAHRLLDADA